MKTRGRATGRWGVLALGLMAVAVVNGLVILGLLNDRGHLVDAAVEVLDGESGMYESYLRRAVAGLDETLLSLGDRLAAGESAATLRPLAAALVRRSSLLHDMYVVDGRSAAPPADAAGPLAGCRPADAALRLTRSADGGGVLVLCRSFGEGRFAIGASVTAKQLTAALDRVKENWASLLEVTLLDGTPLFSLHPTASSSAPVGQLTSLGGQALTARTSMLRDESGRRWLVSEHVVTGYPLTVRVQLPLDRVMDDWRRRVVAASLLAGVASLAFIGGIALLWRQAGSSERLVSRLAESEAEAKAIFHQAHQFIIILDLEGRVRRINDTSIQFFGLAMAEASGRPIWETGWLGIVAEGPQAGEQMRAAVRSAIEGGVTRYETRLRRGQGGEFGVFDVVVKPVRGADGAVREVLLEGRDVTEVAKARENLLRSERLAALGGLVAGIAHEVNTPVGVATTSASYLVREVGELRERVSARTLTTSRMQEFLVAAEEAARLTLTNCDRAAQIIHSFKQVAVDQIGGEHRRFNLSTYIDEILTSLRPRLKREPHRIEVDCPADLELDTDPGALSHGLTNLIINALVHAFKPGQAGCIRISARMLDSDTVKLVFSDDGCGIPQKLHGQVFDPFFTTRRGAGGSGLGLHILHTAVTVGLRGHLRLVSDTGKGTAFIMTFPRRRDVEGEVKDVTNDVNDIEHAAEITGETK